MDGAKLPDLDFVGRCYDALKVDPLDIEKGGMYGLAIAFGKFVNTPDDQYSYPACMSYMPATGGSFDSVSTSLSSSYDFHSFVNQDGSLTASDPTGQLFSATLSASYTETRDTTESHSAVATYTDAIVRTYGLQLKDTGFGLDPEFSKAVAALPAKDDGTGAYAKFVQRFGTHYGKGALFGGRMHQRIVVDDTDYSSFLSTGVSISAEAKATFDVAAGTATASEQQDRSQKFENATKSTTESIVFAGGDPQQNYDQWSQSVADKPSAIQIQLSPLYDLLTAALFPQDTAIAAKQQLLKTEIDRYLESNGDDVSKTLLQYGDEVAIGLGSTGSPRFLSSDQTQFTHTTGSTDPDDPAQDAALRWVIVNALNPASNGQVKTGDTVALKSAGGAFLDAQAGHDDTYPVGAGLTAPTGANPKTSSTRWRLELADKRPRDEIVDGDFVRFHAEWQDPDGQLGYLLGEPDVNDRAQRVYGFGDAKPPGASIWRLSRHRP